MISVKDLVEANIAEHLLKKRNNKSSLLDPYTINLENIIARAVLRNIFHGIYAVVNSLKHDLEYQLLSPELGLNLLYRP